MIRKIICINSLVIIALAAFFLIYPPIRAALDLRDPALQRPGIPKSALRLYRSLTPRYAIWARARVAGGQAENISTSDISGTEWPVFGSIFYLWAIENLQSAWESGDHSAGVEPKVFAKEAIIAASELAVDPKHAGWVKKHWGENYLHRENVFYRMVLIAAITTREKLLHDGVHLAQLRDQVQSLARDIDSSDTGLLDDYPGQCFPGDVMAALMSIERAGPMLGTNYSSLINRGLRGFTGTKASRHGLPPYTASSRTGIPESGARGCANAYVCLTAPELWPAQARQWYELYDRFFWQERFTIAGYREHPKGVPNSNWMMDVDAGPVVAGFGVSASAFGTGAARKNGRFDRAYPLAAELLATAVELPTGALAVPRLLSNLSDAPLLGEAAILWLLSIQPEKGFPVKTGGTVPTYVYVVLSVVFLLGLWRVLASIWAFKQALRPPEPEISAPGFQVTAWACLMIGAVALFFTGHALIALVALIAGVMLPREKRKKAPKGAEDWPDTNSPVGPTSAANPGS